MVKTNFLQVFGITLASFLSLYLSDFGLLQKPFLVAFMSYLMLLFVIGVVILRSFRWGFKAVFSALVTVSFLSLIHVLSFPSYDPLAPVAYFSVLLLSFLINLYILYARFIQNRPLFKVYDSSKLALTVVIVSTIIVGLILASQELMEQFGILIMVGSALAYLIMLFFLAPLIRLEGKFKDAKTLSQNEKRVKAFVHKYGKKKALHPFYASWLGSAVSSIEDYIDGLEAKGHLGHNFFSVQNFLLWISTILSFLIGVASARGPLAVSLVPFIPFLAGIIFIAPQGFMKRKVRRISGIFMLLASMSVLYLWGFVPLRFGAYAALTALVSIYFAYNDDEIISMVFASFFVGALFVLGYSLWKVPVVLTSTPWIMTAAVFLLLVYEYYTKELKAS
ncbi:MAG: hypothetical protein GOV01_01580 [Candidatus Altiarchaeota archaeon]|nr:hypothetical protein [Candidatus Altiarchaeota archaeon]